MEHRPLRIRFLKPAERYLKSLLNTERAMIDADTDAMANREGSVRTKQLRGPVRELIAGNHRLTYFVLDETIYFVRGFRKKTAKTPTQEIRYAEQVYKILKEQL